MSKPYGAKARTIATALPMALRHVTVTARDPLFIIGDVHGCADELKLLLKQKPSDATVVFVGDLVNKGPKSAECVKIARECNALCIKGNHELAVLGALEARAEATSPAARATIQPKYAWTDALSAEDVDWLLALPYTITFPYHNSIVVHAGILPDIPLVEQHWSDLTCMRDAIRAVDDPAAAEAAAVTTATDDVSNGSASEWVGLEKPRDGSVPWASTWQGPDHVYFGHDAKRKLQTYEHATGLDTGCLYGFDLTAVSLPGTRAAPGGELHSVPALEAYIKPSGNPTPRSKISTDSSFFSTFAANNKVAIGVSGVLLAFAFHQAIQLWLDI